MKEKIKQTILGILADMRANGDVLPYATSIEVAHQLHMNAQKVEQIDKMLNAGISDSQLYNLAGNSICVDCMVALFDNLFFPTEEQLTLF